MRALVLVLLLAGCGPTTLAGPCQTTCDCDRNRPAPIRCPGEWTCNASKTCEYGCFEACATDGGCASGTCTDSFCRSATTCP